MSGTFCLVLHGHLPWVLHHGRWPHGEDWLFEAVSETWLPLLRVLEQCEEEGLQPAWSLGLTPILLEQLASPRFKAGFRVWLHDAVERAERDAVEFSQAPHREWLAQQEAVRFRALIEQFEGIESIAGAFAAHRDAGRIELMTSNATHGYHPLILHDRCARAQLRAGIACSERHLGATPAGAWIPECAYRPEGRWMPPALHGDEREREGVGSLAAEVGIEFFFVDTHLVRGSRAVAVREDGVFQPADEAQPGWDVIRGWRSELEPHRVAEHDRVLPVTVLARCPDVSEQVWSGSVGYPGDGRYLEFHKRHGQAGHRYWKVTGRDVDLGGKAEYVPHEAEEAVREHAQHFVSVVAERLATHRSRTGREGVVCAPFDAELFGHWWHEGPQFLLGVARAMRDAGIQCSTVSQALRENPADKAVALPEGTWGAGGDHRVWMHDELRFYWEIAYRAEDRFLALLPRVLGNAEAVELLQEAGRQLLLLQSSDWPFVISTEGAVDYGLRRILDHAGRFDDLALGVEDALAGRPRDPVVTSSLARSRLVDPVFPDLDLAWWS